MNLEPHIDVEMPIPKAGEVRCDYCWKIGKLGPGWATYNFKHLQQVNLCPSCVPKEGQRLTQLQRYGL